MIFAIPVLMLLLQVGEPVFTAAPNEAGVWLLQNEAWLPMLSASAAGANIRGFDNYIYTGGQTNLDVDISFTGAKAAIRTSDRKPVFMARKEDNGGFEPVLVRLEKKKDRRICRTRPNSATVDNKHGFRKQDIIRTILTVNPDKSITVRPERTLKPGEYLLVISLSSLGRDFGVD